MSNNGRIKPDWIYGTAWKEEATKQLVIQALNSGFTAIDTANQRKHYHEAAVGDALKEVAIDRDQLFLQTKFTFMAGQDERLPYDPHDSISHQVEQSFESSLKHLDTDYIDSYLLHGPSFQEGLCEDDLEAWAAMEKLYRSGQVRALGVSNFSPAQLEDLNHYAGIKPAFIQNRCYAVTGWGKDVRDICQRHCIDYQGFSLLTSNSTVGKQPVFQSIVDRTGMTAAQVIFQASIKMGITPLTGSSSKIHIADDLNCLRSELTQNEVNSIEIMMQPPK